MLKTAFIIYRQWGFEIFKDIYAYQQVRQDFVLDTLIIATNSDVRVEAKYKNKLNYYSIDPADDDRLLAILKKNKIELAFFYSWSFIVGQKILNNFTCLCLHPSKLPAYRGGTPIQNQLIENVQNSAITIFKMNDSIDAGDIYGQANISLLGDINQIFGRMIELGSLLTRDLITDAVNQELRFVPQKRVTTTKIYQRRRPSQSRVEFDQLQTMQYQALNNLVRGLLDPYPNLYINLAKGKLIILKIEKYKKLPSGAQSVVFDSKIMQFKPDKPYFMTLKDGYAKLVEYRFQSL